VIVRQLHLAIHKSLEWAQYALANDISNTTTERSNLYKKFMDPMSWLQYRRIGKQDRLIR